MSTGLCECGCGNSTRIAPRNHAGKGWVKGQPLRFCMGHGGGLAKRKGETRRSAPEYTAFHDARQRCTNSNNKRYPQYGGRGIQMKFRSFEEFFAEIGPRPSPELSLDRIRTDGHYEPGNVRWATVAQQMASRRLSGAALMSHINRAQSTAA
jgi:hypothetical protein